MGDVWGHVGLGMGPILITHESIFMALAPQPGMPGSVPIGGRYSVQSKSGQPQHGSGSSRIPAYKPPAGGDAPGGNFIMPPPPPPAPRREESRAWEHGPTPPLHPPPGAWDDPWQQPPDFVPTAPAGGTNPDKPRGGWYERCIDLMVLVDNLPFNEQTHEAKHFLSQLQRIPPPNGKSMPIWRGARGW